MLVAQRRHRLMRLCTRLHRGFSTRVKCLEDYLETKRYGPRVHVIVFSTHRLPHSKEGRRNFRDTTLTAMNRGAASSCTLQGYTINFPVRNANPKPQVPIRKKKNVIFRSLANIEMRARPCKWEYCNLVSHKLN